MYKTWEAPRYPSGWTCRQACLSAVTLSPWLILHVSILILTLVLAVKLHLTFFSYNYILLIACSSKTCVLGQSYHSLKFLIWRNIFMSWCRKCLCSMHVMNWCNRSDLSQNTWVPLQTFSWSNNTTSLYLPTV